MKIVDDEKAEEAAWCVSMRVADTDPEYFEMFPDCIRGNCQLCGEAISWRPHSPKNVTKICMPCAIDKIGGVEHLVRIGTTKLESLTDAIDYLRRRGS